MHKSNEFIGILHATTFFDKNEFKRYWHGIGEYFINYISWWKQKHMLKIK